MNQPAAIATRQPAGRQHPVRNEVVGDAEPARLPESHHRRKNRRGTERQHRKNREHEDRAARHDHGLLAFHAALVNQVTGLHFQQGDSGGERRQRHQHVEQRPQHDPKGYLGIEQLGERNKEHPHRGLAHFLAQPATEKITENMMTVATSAINVSKATMAPADFTMDCLREM